jgi:hypothetical protein
MMMFPVLGVVVPGLSEYAESFGLFGEKKALRRREVKGMFSVLARVATSSRAATTDVAGRG